MAHHYEWFKNQCIFFHQHHRTDRWDLTNREDSFQLYYQIRILSLRYLDLYQLLSRDHQYSRAHEMWGRYSALHNLLIWLFPLKSSPFETFSATFNSVQREIAELEEKYGVN